MAVPEAAEIAVTTPVDIPSIAVIVNVKSFVGEDPKTAVPGIENDCDELYPEPAPLIAKVYVPAFNVTSTVKPVPVRLDLLTFVYVKELTAVPVTEYVATAPPDTVSTVIITSFAGDVPPTSVPATVIVSA